MKKNLITKKVVLCAILIGIMFVLSWTPLGMVPLGFVSPTTVFIPVAVGIILLDDWKYSLTLGVAFGVVSWIRSFVPSGVLDPYFVNPLVSVLPRALMANVVHYIYQLVKMINIKTKVINYGIVGAICAIFNTIFTIGMLSLVYYNNITSLLINNELSWAKWLFGTIVLLNMIPELILGAICNGAICRVLDKFILSNNNNNINIEEINE